MSLLNIFKELSQSTTAHGTVTVQEVPGHANIFLGMNADGDALVLFLDSGDPRPSRKLESIAIDYGRVYSILKNSVVTNDKYSSIRLYKRESQLLESFCLLVDALVNNVAIKSDSYGVRSVIDDFVKLFERKTGNLRDRVKGLFGELLIISESDDAGKWIDAWHMDVNSNKDFSFDGHFLEVKTSESKDRSHRIGLSQLTSTQKTCFVASIGLLEDPSGITVFDLLERLLIKNLGVEHQEKLVRLFYQTLGAEASDAREFIFGPSELKPQIIFLRGDQLPKPEIPLGAYSAAIKEVTFGFSVEKLLQEGFQTVDFKSL